VWEDVGCTGVTRPALYHRSLTAKEAKQLGPADTVKRCRKNDFMRHLTPHTTHPIRHGNTANVSETGPMIALGSAKAQGTKAKPVNGSEAL
jgi:hypothetical protein